MATAWLEHDSTQGQSGGRREYVRPAPKRKDQGEKRQRANTIGAARSTQLPDDGVEQLTRDVDEILHLSGDEADMEHDSFHSDTDDKGEEKPMAGEGDSRPLEEVAEGIIDDNAKEFGVRVRNRVIDHSSRLDVLEYEVRAQSAQLKDVKALMGAHVRIFPPKNTTAADLRSKLTRAFWNGTFGIAVAYISQEYEIPFSMQIAMASAFDIVADICRTEVSGCFPQLLSSTSVGPQEQQCQEFRSELAKANRNSNAHSNYTIGEWVFLFGFPMTRRVKEDGNLDDSDCWSVEVLIQDPHAGTERTMVLLTCVYDHVARLQKFTIDLRTLNFLEWCKDDIRSIFPKLPEIFLPRVSWVGDDDALLPVLGKRRFRQQQKGSKGKFPSVDVTPPPKGVGILGGKGVPNSFKSGPFGGKNSAGFGKQDSVGKQQGFGKQGCGKQKGSADYSGANHFSGNKGFADYNGGQQFIGKPFSGGKSFGDGGCGKPMAGQSFGFPPQPPQLQQGFSAKGPIPPPPQYGDRYHSMGSFPDPYQMMQQMLQSKGSGGYQHQNGY